MSSRPELSKKGVKVGGEREREKKTTKISKDYFSSQVLSYARYRTQDGQSFVPGLDD